MVGRPAWDILSKPDTWEAMEVLHAETALINTSEALNPMEVWEAFNLSEARVPLQQMKE
jgi:hypothetical protein